MKKVLIILAVVLALAGFGAYKLFNSFSKGAEHGDVAIAAFHEDYNANRIAKIYADASPGLRSIGSEADYTTHINILRQMLGDWKSGERTGINLNKDNGTVTLGLACSAKFEKAEGKEQFVFDFSGDKPLLRLYRVESSAFGDTFIPVFHTDYNAKRIDAIHSAASPEFQTAVPADKFRELLTALHEKLGQWKSGNRTSFSLKDNNSGKKVLEVSWSAKFEKGEGIEVFTFDCSGAKPILLGYHVKSPKLGAAEPATP